MSMLSQTYIGKYYEGSQELSVSTKSIPGQDNDSYVILGESGYGKSVAAQSIVLQKANQSYSVRSIDIHNSSAPEHLFPIFRKSFEHPEAVLQGRVLIGCGRTLHHFGADSFCFFTGDVGANSLHDCNSGVRIRDRHSEQPWFPACSGHSCDAAIARRGFQPGRFSFGWNGRWSYCTGGWRCANGMPAGRAEFSGI